MGITKDAVVDYGLDPTGTIDIIPTVAGIMRTEAIGQDFVDITYPAGNYLCDAYGGFGGNYIPECGDYILRGAGATFINDASGGAYTPSSNHIAQVGIDITTGGIPPGFTAAGGQSARLQTALAGATSVTLTAASASAGHISRFSIGQHMLVCSWCIQGSFQGGYSFPPNYHWNDHVLITNIVGNTIHFTPALKFHHDENWPEINRGTALEADAAGPATAVALAKNWTGTTVVNDATFDFPALGGATFLNCYRQHFIANNVTCIGKVIYPSVQETFTAINSNSPNVLVEADKNVDTVTITGGTYRTWKAQSSSTRLLTIDGVTITNNLQGTARNTVIQNSSVGGTTELGPIAYGRGETFRAENTSFGGAITGGILVKGTRFQDQGVQEALFMDSGVLRVPMCLGADILSFLMPDSLGRNVCLWSSNVGSFGSFKILSCTSDRWPAVDNQTATVGITTTQGSRIITTSTPTFTLADVGKVVYLPNILSGTGSGFEDVTMTNASPGVVTKSSHGYGVNDTVRFQAGSGVLPAEISAGVNYYVVSVPTSNTFTVSATVGGAAINTSGGSGTIQKSYSSSIYTFITEYIDSTNVEIFDPATFYSLSSAPRNIQWGTCNAYMQTDLSGGMPDASLLPTTNKLSLLIPPVRSVYFNNCTGTNQVLDLCQAPAQNKPMWTYTKRTHNGQTGFTGTTGPSVVMHGNVISLKVNVITPYTGAGTLTLGAIFRRMRGDIYTGTYDFYVPVINMKEPGERVMLPNGVTTGAKTGDSNLNLAATNWATGNFYPQFNRSITAEGPGDWTGPAPEFTMELITDYGIAENPLETPVNVAPLHLRLHG